MVSPVAPRPQDQAPLPTTPDDLPIPWRPVSSKLIPVRCLSTLITCAPPIVAGVILALVVSPWWWWLAGGFAVICALTLLLIPRQVRAIGYAEREEDLLIRKGVMWRQWLVVPYGRMQYVDVSAGPLQRSRGIATVQLHTAAAQADASLPGLVKAEADRLRDRLAQAGHAQMAGL
ncbi:MAG: PH domain-containing protein [Propionibacteriaceae bacterium]|jgi:membrane protein YdbS with pleckstrin-like domain|nr:PH domain-containing protein [Propionibacteriaceae bacterium]